jgi:XTP/dITP diphosphohydrolase
MTEQIRFLTKNPGKFRELKQLLDPKRYKLIRDSTEIRELQTIDMDALVRDKVLKAFEHIRHPLIVDHTGLEFDLLKGFPGGLTSVFYDTLGDEGIASLIGASANPNVTAVTLIAYCDGRTIYSFRGEARGTVAAYPRGKYNFQWDVLFVPKGYDKTYAQLSQRKKNEISMRRRAFDKFAAFLKDRKQGKT